MAGATAHHDRLRLDEERLEGIASALETVSGLPDPVGQEMARWQRPNGLDIARVRVPIGVIGMIYESRPNVTADAAAICVRSGNAIILRPGMEIAQLTFSMISSPTKQNYKKVGRFAKDNWKHFVPAKSKKVVKK